MFPVNKSVKYTNKQKLSDVLQDLKQSAVLLSDIRVRGQRSGVGGQRSGVGVDWLAVWGLWYVERMTINFSLKTTS